MTNAYQLTTRDREAVERERQSLADALVQLCGPDPQSASEIHAAALDDWGKCSLRRVKRQLRALRRAGLVRRDGGGYVAAGGWRWR